MFVSNHLNKINSLLGQIRQYESQAEQGVDLPSGARVEGDQKPGTSFASAVKGAVDQVNSLQQASSAQKVSYELGGSNSLPDVVLSMQKSSLAFEATVQVRNKVLKAYEEIMNMPV